METITLSSFKFYKKIGEGAFGEVYLVRREKQEHFLALKAIRKERVYGTNLYRYIQTEKDILSLLNHPFIVRLRYAFQTETYLFLAMDYCEGGDLSRLLEKRKKFSEQQVRHYASEILLGLEALHKHGIIYRDLKP
jgi:serine/threonine protein kinase